MGRLAGENKVYALNSLEKGCPPFVLLQVISTGVVYSEKEVGIGKGHTTLIDITNLPKESQYYLKLLEITAVDSFTSPRDDAYELAKLIIDFCEDFKAELYHNYGVLLGKATLMIGVKTLEGVNGTSLKYLNLELRSQIDTLKDYVINLLCNIEGRKALEGRVEVVE